MSYPNQTKSNGEAGEIVPPLSLPPDYVPPNFTLATVYANLSQASQQAIITRKMVEKQGRNQHRISRRMDQSDDRILFLERDGIIGALKIEGRGVPPAKAREKLFPLVQNLAWRNHRISIGPLDVDKVERMNQGKYSPIIVKFNSSHSESALFALMSPVKRQQMRDWKCFWNRYQTKHDFTILAFFSNISLGDLLSCFRPRGVLSGLTTLLVDKVERELVGLEVKVLCLLPSRLVRLNGEKFIFIKLGLV